MSWDILNFKGQTQESMVTKITLSQPSTIYNVRKEISPVRIGFEISQRNMTGLKVNSLKVDNVEDEDVDKWVRYWTVSGSYLIRI